MYFDADLSKVDEGVWKDYDGSSFLVTHMSNKKFQKALSRLQHPHRRKLQDGALDPEINRNIVRQAMAEGILIDWKDVKTRSGDEVPYTVQNAVALLSRDPDFLNWVTEVSTDMSSFRDEEVKELGEG